MRKVFSVFIASAFLFGCSSEAKKKVMVMGRGELTANGNTVTLKDGAGHAEQVLELEKNVGELAIDMDGTKKNMKIPTEGGFFLVNLKKDTIVGSLQQLGTDLNRGVMTQEELQKVIDSLQAMTTGANIKSGGNNLMVLPNEVKKISSNEDARVFGPYNGIPGEIETGKDGKAPEIYKLYTNTQLRERIENFKKATINLDN